MQICKRCLMPETRPRLKFTENGLCPACEWADIKKKEINWNTRRKELEELCDAVKGKGQWDCIVPVSGGKDSTYVADKMKNEFGLNVVTITVTPPLETRLIQKNLARFLEKGFSNIKLTPDPEIMRKINKRCFIGQGRPLNGWTSCVNAAMFRFATYFHIPLVMFGEEGETEYGGTIKLRYVPYYDMDFAIQVYTEGNDPRRYLFDYSEGDLRLWLYPDENDMRRADFKVAHLSYYEDWDPYAHYLFSKEYYGMAENEGRNTGTYSDFGQIDTPMYILHTYMMYLKFGFGRCLQDACIDIRGGRMSREEAIKIVNQYDGEPIDEYIPVFLDYFQMGREEFDKVLQKHTNKDLFEWDHGSLVRKFTIE